jgi:5-formyltetrahydrofolate cyclo-ligase
MQLVDRVPAAPHDVPVQALTTEIRTLPMPG